VGAIGQGGRGEGPGAKAVGGGGAEVGGAVIDGERAVGFRCAADRQGVVAGEAVAGGGGIVAVAGDERGIRIDGVHGHGQCARGEADIAGGVGGGGGEAVGAIGQGGRGEGPGAKAVGGGGAEAGGAVIDGERAVGFRRAADRQGVVAGDAVAGGGGVVAVAGDDRGGRWGGIDYQNSRRVVACRATQIGAVALRVLDGGAVKVEAVDDQIGGVLPEGNGVGEGQAVGRKTGQRGSAAVVELENGQPSHGDVLTEGDDQINRVAYLQSAIVHAVGD